VETRARRAASARDAEADGAGVRAWLRSFASAVRAADVDGARALFSAGS
jgi:hypothetical protein